MTTDTPSAVSFALVQAEKRSRFDPLKDLTAEKLVAYMDEFRAGQVQNLARVMDAIEERDDVLVAVVPKAKAAVARHGWEVLTVNTEDEAEQNLAEEQKAALEYFYNHLRATSALDQDEAGGMSLLLRQMMDAKGKRYAIHNLVWSPRPDGRYTATFHFVPLWFFENSTGKMRFISQPFGFYGEDMVPGEWLVTKGQGVMIACSVAWMYKRLPLRDWLIYCSRHGMPGIEGITDAPEGSDEWNKLVTAVQSAAKEFAWVRSRSSEIKTIEFSTQGRLPYAPLVERMDRAMAAIWRGGDLSTMSKDGSAVGANPQASETVLIEEDDAAWLSETLQLKVDRLVLDYIFGEDAPALAYVKVLTAQKQNTELDLKIDEFALRNGHPISRQQFAERYNRPVPEEDDELLAAPPPQPANGFPASRGPAPDDGEDLEAEAAANEAATQATAAAFAADLQPVLERLDRILTIADDTIRTVKLREFAADLERIKQDVLADPASARMLESILARNFFKGLTPASNERWITLEGGRRVLIDDGPFDAEAANNWKPPEAELSRRLSIGRAAMDRVIRLQRDEWAAVSRPGLGPVDFRWGKPGSPPQFSEGSGVSKIIAKRDYESKTNPEFAGQTGTHVARAMVETVLRGKVGQPYERGNKVNVNWRNFQAVLSRGHADGGGHWLLTGFIQEKENAR